MNFIKIDDGNAMMIGEPYRDYELFEWRWFCNVAIINNRVGRAFCISAETYEGLIEERSKLIVGYQNNTEGEVECGQPITV